MRPELTGHIGGGVFHIDNLVLVVPIAVFLLIVLGPRLMKRRSGLEEQSIPVKNGGITTRLALAVLGLVLIQTSHMLEHFAQVTQKFALAVKPAHGLIGTLDLEWVHVIYNTAVFLPMIGLFIVSGFRSRDSWASKKPMLLYVFVSSFLLQGYHISEHLMKIVQHIETGIQGTPGILGPFLDLALYHYYLNVGVYIPLMAVFFFYGFHRHVLNYVFHRQPGISEIGASVPLDFGPSTPSGSKISKKAKKLQ